MADYIWTESAGTSVELVPRVAETQFGDGYVQVSDDGLNPLAEAWDVVHDNVEAAIADEIEAFVRPGLGRAVFDWVPPGRTTSLKFRCKSFRRSLTSEWGFVNLSLRFEQWFGP